MLLACFIGYQFAFAQDVITLKTGDEIKSKVLEVGTNEIKYKKSDNLDGPSYSVAKSDVFMIKYENGSKDVFSASAISDSTKKADKKPTYPKYANITQFGYAAGFGSLNYSYSYYDPFTGPITIEQEIENTLKIVQLTTINAVQINNYFSVGMGLGFHYYTDEGQHAITLPVFLDVRGTFFGTQDISPVVFFDIGPSIKIDNADGMDGLIMEPGAGVRIPTGNMAVNLSVSYMMQKVSNVGYDYQTGENIGATLKFLSFKFGLAF
jgi:hypothetical protein